MNNIKQNKIDDNRYELFIKSLKEEVEFNEEYKYEKELNIDEDFDFDKIYEVVDNKISMGYIVMYNDNDYRYIYKNYYQYKLFKMFDYVSRYVDDIIKINKN